MSNFIFVHTFPIYDDILYLILLLASIFIGSLVRSVSHVQTKQICCTVIGFFIAFILSGIYIIHPIIVITVNACIVLYFDKRKCHIVSFVFCFGYLVFLRAAMHVGLAVSSELTNTVLMILILKMVGLAYEVNINYSEAKKLLDSDRDHLADLTFCSILHYSFCYAGMLVGPYYKYQTYVDFLHSPYSKYIPYPHFLKGRISVVPVYLSLYLLSDFLFPCSIISSNQLLEQPFLYRVFFMTPWFFTFRMRMYVAFILGECICINLGLGAYPEESVPLPGAGPTDLGTLQTMKKTANFESLGYSFETIRCMDEYASEFGITMREGIRYWNLTVQYWLAVYIYKKTNASKPVKLMATMLTSAIWHGVRLGYYLSLLGTPILLITEMEVRKAFRPLFEKRWFGFVWYIIKMQCLAYMGIAFMLPNVYDTLQYWRSIYYIVHVFLFIVLAVALLVNLQFKTHVKKDKSS